MAKTANELLQGILGVMMKINQKIDQSKKTTENKGKETSNVKGALNIAGNLTSFGKVDEKTKKSFISFMRSMSNIVKNDKGKSFYYFSQGILKISTALPYLIKNLTELGKLKSNSVDKAILTLKRLYDFMHEMGDGRKSKRIKNAVSLFTRMGFALDKIAKPIRSLSMTLLYLAAGLVSFAASILLTSMLLKLTKPSDVFLFLIFTAVSLSIMFGVLYFANKVVGKGVDVIKRMGTGMMYLAGGILAFTLSMVLTGKLIGKNFDDVWKGLAAFVGGMVLIFLILHFAKKWVSKGVGVLKNMGVGLMFLALGIFAFTLSMLITGALIGSNSIWDISKGLMAFMVGMGLMFGILAASEKWVTKGSNVLKEMGIGMMFLAGGILAFVLVMALIPHLFSKEEGVGTIALSLVLMGSIVAAAIGLFWLAGKAAESVTKGTGVMMLMSLGLVVLSAAIVAVAVAAKFLSGGSLSLSKQDVKGTDANKTMILQGLGTFGLILLASVAAFAILGAPGINLLIITGVGVAIGIAIALGSLAYAVGMLAKTSKELEKEDIGEQISHLVGGTITGLLGGFGALSGNPKGIAGDPTGISKGFMAVTNFIGNSVKIFAGLGVLMAMSLTLSQFAYAISAFAEIDNMRVIEGYDEKTGKPKFGAKVDIKNVAATMTSSISTFLTALVGINGLTKDKAKALKKLGRALTGSRGILSAVSDFANVLKTFAQFGPLGQIGYVEMVPDPTATEENGKPMFKQVPKTVKITEVATNIADSFGIFVDELVKHTSIFEITGEKGRSMMRLATVLMGSEPYQFLSLSFGRKKPGLLEPITKFAEILNQFAGGDGTTIPLLDKDGKFIKDVEVKKIAANILTALTDFATQLGSANVLTSTEKAEKNIGKFSDLMDSTNKIAESLDGMSKLSLSVKDLAEGIGLLAVNVDKLNTEKLQQILNKTTSASAKVIIANNQQQKIEESGAESYSKGGSAYKEPNWDLISQQIGEQVGAKVAAAFRNGQFTFEFSPSSNKDGIFYLHPR